MTEYTFTVLGNPIPKARPRLARGHVYTPSRTKAWEQAVALAYHGPLFSGYVGLRLHFYRKTHHLVDVDNICKAAMDGLNKKAYHDDNQVHYLEARLDYDADNPRLEATVWELGGDE